MAHCPGKINHEETVTEIQRRLLCHHVTTSSSLLIHTASSAPVTRTAGLLI